MTEENQNKDIGPYSAAVEEYLAGAEWLTPLDAPLVVHARSIAASLDKQMAAKGEIQSALAGSFDKVMLRLDTRRPKELGGPPPDPSADGPGGTRSIFSYLD